MFRAMENENVAPYYDDERFNVDTQSFELAHCAGAQAGNTKDQHQRLFQAQEKGFGRLDGEKGKQTEV